MFKKFRISLLLFPLIISACKMDFYGDLYTSDLIDVAENSNEFVLPMEVRFQVTDCEDDLTGVHNTLFKCHSTKFSQKSFI